MSLGKFEDGASILKRKRKSTRGTSNPIYQVFKQRSLALVKHNKIKILEPTSRNNWIINGYTRNNIQNPNRTN